MGSRRAVSSCPGTRRPLCLAIPSSSTTTVRRADKVLAVVQTRARLRWIRRASLPARSLWHQDQVGPSLPNGGRFELRLLSSSGRPLTGRPPTLSWWSPLGAGVADQADASRDTNRQSCIPREELSFLAGVLFLLPAVIREHGSLIAARLRRGLASALVRPMMRTRGRWPPSQTNTRWCQLREQPGHGRAREKFFAGPASAFSLALLTAALETNPVCAAAPCMKSLAPAGLLEPQVDPYT